MRGKIYALILGLMIFQSSLSHAQKIIGLWEVKDVKVGDEIMTPVAKWTKLNKDGTYQSGNGWLQNAEGIWSYDKKTKSLSLQEQYGLKDEFGSFKINLSKEGMIWQREEDGMLVTVTLERISALPKSTADYLIGLWGLTTISQNAKLITEAFDPNAKHYIFIRWDRIYVERTPEGKRTTGYWHIHGHRPELTFLSHNLANKAERWEVSVSNTKLKMRGLSENNKGIERTYTRLDIFPK